METNLENSGTISEDNQTQMICGLAVLPDGICSVRIKVKKGFIDTVEKISALEETAPLIFPGLMDIHVHAREYPQPSTASPLERAQWETACRKETFLSAGKAAINGGVTLYAAMPNDPYPPDRLEAYAAKQTIASSSPCPVILFAAVTASSEPWADLPYKVYLDVKPGSCSFHKWADLGNVLERYRGCRMFFHAEDPLVIEQLGSSGPRWKRRPPEAEIAAVDRILEFTVQYGLQTHFCHVSTESAMNMIVDFNRSSSMPVTCEVTPHHLFFSVSDEGVKGNGLPVNRPPILFDCNPPLRSESDRKFMLHALKHGLVDVLASDHAPHTLQEKNNGAPGMPHLDTLGAFAGWLITVCDYSAVRIAEILAAVPARIMSKNLDRPRGTIRNGFAASFTVLDMTRFTLTDDAQIVGRGPLETLCSWSPFSGVPLPGLVVGTVIDGREHAFQTV